jgi:diguanylate cyclase (GGDEF)-like protein
MTDGLTRLRNRRAFEERFDNELVLAVEGIAPLSLILVDIDFFKSINDDFGHSTGDDILCTVARILVKTCRTIDLVARHGGEEFAILLPNTGREAAMVCAERLRAAVEGYPWAERKITISLGVASWTPSMAGKATLFEAADGGLYRAKAEGRNRSVCHQVTEALAATPV